MSLLDAGLEPKPVQEEKPGSLKVLMWLGMAAVGLAIGLVLLFAPKRANHTVRKVVQAAQALLKQEPRKQPDDTLREESKPLLKPKPRRAAGAEEKPSAIESIRPDVSRAHAAVPALEPSRNAELQPGTTRAVVRDMLGEPDLAVYKLEKEHVMEHFVYVNRAQSSATSVLLVDGRVTSVYSGLPSVVWIGGIRARLGTRAKD